MRRIKKIRHVLTEEMLSTIRDNEYTNEEVGAIIRQVIYPDEFEVNGICRREARKLYPDFLRTMLSCAESVINEDERWQRFYAGKKHFPKDWKQYYAISSQYFGNIISTLRNVLQCCGNVTEMFPKHYKEVSQCCDNISSFFAYENENENENEKEKENTKTVNKRIPPMSPKGDEESSSSSSEPPSILDDPDVVMAEEEAAVDERKVEAEKIAGEIEAKYPYKGNAGKLRKCLISLLKKNSAADILKGYRMWMEHWAKDDYRYAPRRIRDWLYDSKFLEAPVGFVKEAKRVDEVQSSSSELA